MKAIKRLFVIFPLRLLFILVCFTLVIPLLYWVFTGKDLSIEGLGYIQNIEDNIL